MPSPGWGGAGCVSCLVLFSCTGDKHVRGGRHNAVPCGSAAVAGSGHSSAAPASGWCTQRGSFSTDWGFTAGAARPSSVTRATRARLPAQVAAVAAGAGGAPCRRTGAGGHQRLSGARSSRPGSLEGRVPRTSLSAHLVRALSPSTAWVSVGTQPPITRDLWGHHRGDYHQDRHRLGGSKRRTLFLTLLETGGPPRRPGLSP